MLHHSIPPKKRQERQRGTATAGVVGRKICRLTKKRGWACAKTGKKWRNTKKLINFIQKNEFIVWTFFNGWCRIKRSM
jgi:hypothetical protein